MTILIVKANGAEIPSIGFGTAQLAGAACEMAVGAALEDGYRHIDTAQSYANEGEIGRAIRGSIVKLDEVFLTSKIWMDSFQEGDLERAVEGSLERLSTDCIDLVLLHWPNPEVPLKETMEALCRVKDRGMAAHIGVSNFTVDLLHEAANYADEPLVTNQVEYHPYLDQSALLEACRTHGLALTAYSPLAQGKVFKDKTLQEIGAEKGKNPGQIAIRWLIQQENVVAIPRSAEREHIRQNNDVFDFELSNEEMARIAALARPDGRLVNPSFAPAWDEEAA